MILIVLIAEVDFGQDFDHRLARRGEHANVVARG